MIGSAEIGNVFVKTTSNRGATAEELTDRAVGKIMGIFRLADPDVAEEHVRRTLLFYLKEAQTAERTTLSGKLVQQGHDGLAKIIGEL
jgi:hypothetical protein